jgi:hypothetical protein
VGGCIVFPLLVLSFLRLWQMILHGSIPTVEGWDTASWGGGVDTVVLMFFSIGTVLQTLFSSSIALALCCCWDIIAFALGCITLALHLIVILAAKSVAMWMGDRGHAADCKHCANCLLL